MASLSAPLVAFFFEPASEALLSPPKAKFYKLSCSIFFFARARASSVTLEDLGELGVFAHLLLDDLSLGRGLGLVELGAVKDDVAVAGELFDDIKLVIVEEGDELVFAVAGVLGALEAVEDVARHLLRHERVGVVLGQLTLQPKGVDFERVEGALARRASCRFFARCGGRGGRRELCLDRVLLVLVAVLVLVFVLVPKLDVGGRFLSLVLLFFFFIQ